MTDLRKKTEIRNESICLCRRFNTSDNPSEKRYLASRIFRSIGENAQIIPPIMVDSRNTAIGDNCFIAPYCRFLDFGGVTIGNNVGIASGVTFATENHPENSAILDKWENSPMPVVIEDDVWIDSDVIILGNVTIGKGSVIGAGSVVLQDVPPGEVWAGVPAKYVETVSEFVSKHGRG